MDNLIKDAKKLLLFAYKEYLRRRKNGASKEQAKDFLCADSMKLKEKHFRKLSMRDYSETLSELKRASFCLKFYDCGFHLEDSSIVYAEGYKRGILKSLWQWFSSLLQQFIRF